MRVLGVDPGLTRCGLGAVGEAGRQPTRRRRHRPHTGRRVPRRPSGAAGKRARGVAGSASPDAVAVERVFSQHNVSTVMGTAQASGVAVLCAARRRLPVALHTPSEVKAAVSGSGKAGKEQVAHMVTRLLRLSDPPRPVDATDALALAICSLWR